MATVEIRGLRKSFGADTESERIALDGIDLTLEDGHTYGLIGPNGAGKTTLMRTLVGIVPPSLGTIRVFGLDVADPSGKARGRLAFLSPTTGLYGRMTARELLIYHGALQGLTPDRTATRLADVAATLSLDELLDRKIEILSHGQKQRVNFARTMLHDPDLYVFDEPTDGLDLMTSRAIVAFMRSLRAAGKLVLISTHDLPLAERLCDRFVFLHRGHILASGIASDLTGATGTHTLEEAFLALAAREGGVSDELDARSNDLRH